VTPITYTVYPDGLWPETTASKFVEAREFEALKRRADALEAEVEAIANADFRGNRSRESVRAFHALETYRRVTP